MIYLSAKKNHESKIGLDIPANGLTADDLLQHDLGSAVRADIILGALKCYEVLGERTPIEKVLLDTAAARVLYGCTHNIYCLFDIKVHIMAFPIPRVR